MTTLQEGRLQLSFSADWLAVKWDDEHAYRTGICPAGFKAVDVVAARRDGSAVALIECKDFANPAVTPPQLAQIMSRATSGRLESDLVTKVGDTLAGVPFSWPRRGSRPIDLDACADELVDDDAEILVMLWLEHPRVLAPSLSAMMKRLQKSLAWLHARRTPHAASISLITSSSGLPVQGVIHSLTP